MEQEQWLKQTENELFDLVEKIMALTQTTMHSSKEEWRLAALQEWEGQLMIGTEDLRKKIAKTQQGFGIQESDPRGSKKEATEKVEQCQT